MRGSSRRGAVPPPSERTWVHPSELPGSFELAAVPVRTSGTRRFKTLVVSTASALLVAGVALLAQPTGGQVAGASIGPRVATSVGALPKADRAVARSLLALVIYEGQHLGTATAMVLPPGDIAITTTPVARGATVMGRVPGHVSMAMRVVGTDARLGVTVLRLPTTLRVTPTASLAAALSTGGAPTRLTALAAVRGTTTAAEFDYAAAYMNAEPSAATVGRSVLAVTHGKSLAGVIAGSLVLNWRGDAVAEEVPALGATSFVPTAFLAMLAQRIVLGNPARHGWLQLEGAPTSSGALRVVGVAYRGVAWGRVLPGDTIEAIDGVKVRTMADVGSVLYTTSPGQPASITVLRGGHRIVVDVVLASSP
jgi:S1-C subfamily serine protease